MSDERVEAVAAAIAKVSAAMQGDVLATWADHTPEDQWAFREMARAAIDAMDGEPTETLEDVVNSAGIYDVYVLAVTLDDGSDAWECIIREPKRERRAATGATIAAAIRNAVAAAEGSE